MAQPEIDPVTGKRKKRGPKEYFDARRRGIEHSKIEQYMKDRKAKGRQGGKVGEWIRKQQQLQIEQEQEPLSWKKVHYPRPSHTIKLPKGRTVYGPIQMKIPPLPPSKPKVPPLKVPSLITKAIKHGEKQKHKRPFGPAEGRGWHFESEKHSLARIKGGFKSRFALFLKSRIAHRIKKRELIPSRPHAERSPYYYDTEKETSVTYDEIAEEEKDLGTVVVFGENKNLFHYYPNLNKIEFIPTGRFISFQQAKRYQKYYSKKEHKGHPIKFAQGRKKQLERQLAAGKKPKIKVPSAIGFIDYEAWTKKIHLSMERQMKKFLPEGGANITYNNRTIPANPKGGQFNDKRLNKNYNIKIDLTVDDKNYDHVMANIERYYDQRIGAYLKVIMHNLGHFYSPHMMRGMLNFILHKDTGEEMEWDKNVRYVSYNNYHFFRLEAMQGMMDVFKKLKTFSQSTNGVSSITLVYIEISFTTGDGKSSW